MSNGYYIYWNYSNLVKNEAENYYINKKQLLNEQLVSFQQRTEKAAIKQGGTAALEILEALSGEDAEKALTKVFGGDKTVPIFSAGAKTTTNGAFKGKSFQQISGKKAGATFFPKNNAEKLLNNAVKFKEELQKNIELSISELGLNPNAIKSIIHSIIQEVADENNIDKNDKLKIKKFIIDKLLNENNQNFLKVEKGSRSMVDTSLKRAIALMYALPKSKLEAQSQRDFFANTSNKTSEYADFMRTLSRRVSGLFNDSVEFVEEIADAKAARKVVGEALKELPGIKISGSRRIGSSYTTIINDPILVNILSEIEQEPQNFKANKSDISVQFTNNMVKFSAGFSIKKYTPSRSPFSNRFTKITLVSNTPTILGLAYGGLLQNDSFMQSFYNVMTSHSIESTPNDTLFKYGKHEAELLEKWRVAKETAETSALLYSLSGTGKNLSQNAMFLVLNRKVFSIKTVINKVIKNEWKISTTYTDKQFKYGRYSEYNIWATDTKDINENARLRSERTRVNLNQILYNTKMKVSLEVLSSQI